MALVSKAVLKSYFETGDIPTEAQYIDLIDSTFGGDTYISDGLANPTGMFTGETVGQLVGHSANTGTDLIFEMFEGTGTPVSVFQIDGNGNLFNDGDSLIYSPVATSLFIGTGQVDSTKTGIQNVVIGRDTAPIMTSSGRWNTFLGYGVATKLESGIRNVFIGYSAGQQSVSGERNTFIGSLSGLWNTGNDNSFFGLGSGYTNTGNNSTCIGAYSGYAGGGSSSVYLGYYAGRYNTDSNKFILDNQDRTNAANELTNSLIVGTFNATASSQTLQVNAFQTIYMNSTDTTSTGLKIEQAGTGDVKLQLNLTGIKSYSAGIDNSTTANDFVISASNTLGTNPVMTIDGTSFDTTFVNDVYADDFILSSGIKFKENIKTLDGNIEGLRPIEYNIKGKKHKQYGFIAEEVQKTHPDLVRENNKGLAVSYISMIALMAEEIAQLKEKLK